MNIRFVHNHPSGYAYQFSKPTEEVEDRFRHMFENGFSPADALRMYKKQLKLRSPDSYETLVKNRGVCPELSWVQHFYYKVCGGVHMPENVEASDADGIDVGDNTGPTEIANSVCVDHVDQIEVSTDDVKVKPIGDNEMVTESPGYIMPCMDDLIMEVEVEHASEDIKDDHRELDELEECFDAFVNKLEEDPLYYEKGMLSMRDELKKVCESSAAERLSALYSFNRIRKK